jgi:hypothetical protein
VPVLVIGVGVCGLSWWSRLGSRIFGALALYCTCFCVEGISILRGGWWWWWKFFSTGDVYGRVESMDG